ncbi:MAG: hypothetical protein V7L29_26905, partial [Nostoc sp.]|uniref:hypothetical protein n=1 Tax=Nostoc sp. TaxID=1180 RepID=UPI002FFA39A4
LVLLLPSWEKGLGDEGKTSSQSRFFLKLTPMGNAVPLQKSVVQLPENSCKLGITWELEITRK